MKDIHCLIKHHAMKTYCRIGGILHAFLTSARDGVSDQLQAPFALHPGRETPIPIG